MPPLRAEWTLDLLNGIMVIQGEASAINIEEFKDRLYRPITDISFKTHKVVFKAVPYYAWANRKHGPMAVWILLGDGVFEKGF